MSTLDGGRRHDWLHTKGAPEAVLPRCAGHARRRRGRSRCSGAERARIAAVEGFARQGLRVLALAASGRRRARRPPSASDAEPELCFLGLVTM